jgi:Domain of unknown function (DUF4159)
MPAVICRNCGKIVRVQGLAAICPQCGQLVTIKEKDIKDLDPVAAPQPAIPIPPPQPAQPYTSQPQVSTKKIVFGVIAAFVVLVFIIDYIRLRLTPAPTAPPPVAIATPPKPAPAPSPAPVTQPLLFSEDAAPPEPAPATLPAPIAVHKVTPASKPWESLANLHPHHNTSASRADVSDEMIGDAIKRGVDYLLSNFSQSRLKNGDQYEADIFGGLDALCVGALLHSGQAIDDPRLAVTTDLMKAALDRLRDFPMNGGHTTYARALRINAFAVYNRNEDKPKMKEDLDWLLAAAKNGAYSYDNPEWTNTDAKRRRRAGDGWDNSNSQYGALGVWAAMDSGLTVPGDFASYWNDVEKHWIGCQTPSGGWGYQQGGNATLSMTVAGLNMLFVSRQQTSPDAPIPANSDIGTAMHNALEWLDEGDHVQYQFGHTGYTLYGTERAGLATGYKFFGDHDWYLTLASKAVQNQQQNGAWSGGDGPIAETAFTLLFLSRGRHPIFISKLRFDGNWANRPRDIASLTTYASKQIERPLNFQIVGLERSWRDWTDSPVLFIASDKAPNFSNEDIDKLRNFALSGGLIFTHADRDSIEFNNFAKDLAKKLFNKELQPLPDDHLIYNVTFPVAGKTQLSGVSNGARLLMVHCPTDIARFWTRRVANGNKWALELATNIAIYATGKRDFRNRVSSPLIPDLVDSQPIGTIPMALLHYDGNWDPEPFAWLRFAKQFELDTSIRLNLLDMPIKDLAFETTPIAHLTGTDAIALNDEQIGALRQFIVKGGTLFIDSFGGSKTFAQSIRADLLPKLFPSGDLQAMERGHTLLRGPEEGMRDLTEPAVRGYVSESLGKKIPPLQIMHGGAGQVIFSELDVTNGLLGASTWGTMGYQPAYANALIENTIFWTLHQDADYPTTAPKP